MSITYNYVFYRVIVFDIHTHHPFSTTMLIPISICRYSFYISAFAKRDNNLFMSLKFFSCKILYSSGYSSTPRSSKRLLHFLSFLRYYCKYLMWICKLFFIISDSLLQILIFIFNFLRF